MKNKGKGFGRGNGIRKSNTNKLPNYFRNDEYQYKEAKVYKNDVCTDYDFTFIQDLNYNDIFKYLRNTQYNLFGFYNDDIIVESILYSCRQAHNYDETKSSKKTWMSRSLKSLTLQYLNKRNKSKIISYDNNSKDSRIDSDIDFVNYIVVVEEDESGFDEERYENTISLLMTEQFKLLKDRSIDQLSYEELVIKYNKPMHWVKNHLHMLRKELKKLLGETE